MKVAAIQMVSGVSLQHNLEVAHDLLTRAAREGAELAVLPEYFCLLGQRDQDKLAIREPWGHGPIQAFLSDSARTLGLWLVGGTLPLSTGRQDEQPHHPLENNRVFNSTLVYSPEGQCIARYDKIHLFRYDNGRESYDESRVLMPGSQPVTFELPSKDGHRWRVGLSVCYDLRFPELYRAYASQGVDLILVPSAFTHTTGQAHWELLLRSRAVENLSYVIAAAQGGLHENGRRTWGHTLLADPWGRVLSQHDQGPAVVSGDIDFAMVQECRTSLPALIHRVL